MPLLVVMPSKCNLKAPSKYSVQDLWLDNVLCKNEMFCQIYGLGRTNRRQDVDINLYSSAQVNIIVLHNFITAKINNSNLHKLLSSED